MKHKTGIILFVTLLLAACSVAPTPSTIAPAQSVESEPSEAPVATIQAPIEEAQPAVPTQSITDTAPRSTFNERYKDPALTVEQRIDDLLERMNLEEKIGQMTQVEKDSISPRDATRYAIGSILSGGGGSPSKNTPQAWAEMVGAFQAAALDTRLGIPMIYGVDAVHGHNNLMDATIFPHNIGLGAADDPDLMRRIGQATAEEMLATGIPWNFAPVVAVPQDIRWGRTYEGYSESTDIVTRLGAAYLDGLQSLPADESPVPGKSLWVLATPKHFIGDGATIWGSSTANNMGVQYMLDQGNMQVNEATLRERYLPPYQAAVQAGAKSIMASFSSWNGTKLHAQEYLLNDLLKSELGYDGFIVSDWQAIDQIDPNDFYKSVVTAINAGIDMAMVPYDYQRYINTMKKAITNGDIPLERFDDAVRRILRAKFALGLFEQPMPDVSAYQETIRSAAHLELAREAVRKSLVLLKNENNALPLDKNSPLIFVAGSGAGSLEKQLGGWTITWQGDGGGETSGTPLISAIKRAVGADTRVVMNSSAQFKNEKDAAGKPAIADVGIVVVGEEPYAEGVGDDAELALDVADIKAIGRMRERAKKVVVIILSGRPLIITEHLPLADAWVAAWLPGTEGAGVTDVLFGDADFSGKLPYTWPRSTDQLPLNIHNLRDKPDSAGPLFPLGYGLRYDGAMGD